MLQETTRAISNLEDLARQYGQLEEQLAALGAQKENVRKEIIAAFEKEYGHTGAVYATSSGAELQRVIQVRCTYDAELMRKLLGPEQWNKIKKETVDAGRLRSAIDMKIIDSRVISPAVETCEVDQVRYCIPKQVSRAVTSAKKAAARTARKVG